MNPPATYTQAHVCKRKSRQPAGQREKKKREQRERERQKKDRTVLGHSLSRRAPPPPSPLLSATPAPFLFFIQRIPSSPLAYSPHLSAVHFLFRWMCRCTVEPPPPSMKERREPSFRFVFHVLEPLERLRQTRTAGQRRATPDSEGDTGGEGNEQTPTQAEIPQTLPPSPSPPSVLRRTTTR